MLPAWQKKSVLVPLVKEIDACVLRQEVIALRSTHDTNYEAHWTDLNWSESVFVSIKVVNQK